MRSFFLGVSILFISSNAAALLSESIKNIADCSLVNSRKFEIADVLDARSRQQQVKNQYRPRVFGAVNYGEQISEGVTFASSMYSLDMGLPIYSGAIDGDSKIASKAVHVSEAKLIQKTFQMTQVAIFEVLDSMQRKQEIEILTEEKDNYEKLVSTSRASSQAGLSDRSDALLAQMSFQKTKAKIRIIEIETQKTLKVFSERYGFEMPKMEITDFSIQESFDTDITPPELRVADTEIALVASEIQKEKSYLAPQIEFSAGIFSQVGVLPYNGYRVGLSFDLSGLLRNSKIKSSFALRRHAMQEQKNRLKDVLNVERRVDTMAVDALEKQMDSMKEALAFAERAAKLSREKVKLGRASFTEFAAIQDTVRSFRLEYLTLQYKRAYILSKRLAERYFYENQSSLQDATCSLNSQAKN